MILTACTDHLRRPKLKDRGIMGNQIIAEKFALLRTKGSNGIACTHLVEDTLSGRKAIVKIGDGLGPLGFEYLKAINILREYELAGVLLPFEGGILEEDNEFYFAFPEIGEPSLENFLRIGVPLTSQETLGIVDDLLSLLDGLHNSGFYHLFINTRNVFFKPHGSVILKDPALRPEFFQPLLEMIACPDFSYFSPGVMDGMQPDASADIYAVGTLIERLLQEVTDPQSLSTGTLRTIADKCHAATVPESNVGAAEIRDIVSMRHAETDYFDSSNGESATKRIEILDESRWRIEPGDIRAEERSTARPRSIKPFLHVAAGILLMAVLIGGVILSITSMMRPYQEQIVNAAGSDEGIEGTRAAGLQADSTTEGNGANLEEAANQNSGQEAETTAKVEEATTSSGSPQQNTAPASTPSQPAAQPVADASPAAPVASFSVSPSSGQSPLQVCLDASSSYDPDGQIVSYSWSCGGQGRRIFQVFESNVVPTSISVTLTVTDNAGHRSSTNRQITLY
jgi:serine/threonine protein kinase